MSERLTRRRLLQSGTLTGIGVLAGCLGDGDEPTGHRAPPAGSPISEVEIDRSDLVVRLQDDHAVTQLNLVGPDGEMVDETSVSVGVSKARLQLLDIRPGLGGYEHYEPGTHEIVAVTESGSSSMDVELVPDLQIVDVQQYRDGDQASDLGKLAVTVENVGSGPTWVYDIAYENAPNKAANNGLVSDPGVPQLKKPENPLLSPGEHKKFVGSTDPLRLANGSDSPCSGELNFELEVGVADSSLLESKLSAQLDGEEKPVGLIDQYVCSNISIRIGDGEE